MNLPDIPESITQDQLTGLVRSLGIDPEHVMDVTLTATTVTVRRYAIDDSGHRYLATSWTPEGAAVDEVATHTIVIKVVQ